MRTTNTSKTVNPSPYGTWINLFKRIQYFGLECLPLINDRIVAGQGCVYEISLAVENDLSQLISVCEVNDLQKEEAIQVLRCIAPIISSIQRHLETYGCNQKHFSQLFSFNIEAFMVALGRKACLPPRDSAYTTWLFNDSPIYVFDTNPGWKFFWKAVRLTNDNNLKAIECIQQITLGEFHISSSKAIQLIEEATGYISDTFNNYKDFTNGGMNTTYFATVFRTYFLEYTVGGIKYTGSNATNIASVPVLDFVIGIATDQYKEIVNKRFIHYTKDDVWLVNKAMKEPSILQLVIEALGYEYNFFKFATPDEIELNFKKNLLTTDLKKIFASVSNLVHELARWSKVHFGLINTFLIKEEQKLNECPLGYSSPIVNFSHGVGGASHEETKSIRDMRSNCAILKKIALIIKY